ncbi:MAG: SDR family oxidoreductase [Desulfobacterales bacterium]|nr:MAG: SDR family oxidoreductase [Desulfobacterales bacterium]
MILDKFRIDRQVAVVTGGTQGLGRAIAEALAEAGADIAAVSRRSNPELEHTVRSLGRNYYHHAADLTQRAQSRRVIPAVVEKLGDVNILVNNAGIIRRAPAKDYSESDWDATLEIDLNAAFILSQAAGHLMLAQGKGKIINIASVISFQGGLNVSAYAAAKHGIAGLTKALANDWAKHGINVNALAPGFFSTELTEALQKDPQRSESITGRTPAGRWGSPADLAGAAVFLASPASDFVHGVIIPVDGGWMAW